MICGKKSIIYLCFFVLHAHALNAQTDTTLSVNNSTGITGDTVITPGTNKYGDLLNDDPEYNPRYAWWKPAIRVVSADAFNWAVAKYVYKFDWPATSVSDWKH